MPADPKAFPLGTPSGKIEIYSERIASFGYDDCPGHPVWQEPAEWLGSPAAARYPLHLISNQPHTKLHSQYDHGAVSLASKIRGREPIAMHPDDAAARGLTAGDIVRVFNGRGACLAGLRLQPAPDKPRLADAEKLAHQAPRRLGHGVGAGAGVVHHDDEGPGGRLVGGQGAVAAGLAGFPEQPVGRARQVDE